MNYDEVKLKCGLEIHIQLETKHKLFCKCLTTQKGKNLLFVIKRKLHPVMSELGEIDIAAQFEYLRDRDFHYHLFKDETCLVETDSEPPHELNQEALKIALQIALLLNCKIPDEIHVMRKTIIDGSNPSSFQRTMIIGKDGFLIYKNRKIPIQHVCLEEDAAAKVKEDNRKVHYRLNRLGIPLVEISTGILEGFSPKEIEEIAYNIWLICKSTGKIKEEIGSVRQDVNVSIKSGARVEIKGIQRLSLISKVIENEIKRQLKILEKGKKVKEETRAANLDGTTRYTRPLPGSARMYPETDIVPITTKGLLKEIKLPELLTEKIKRFRSAYKLSEELISGLLRSPYLHLFDVIVRKTKIKPKIVANYFASTLKDLKRRERLEINLTERQFYDLFKAIEKKKIVKEALPEITKYLIKNPEKTIEDAITELNLQMLTKRELEKIVWEIFEKTKDAKATLSLAMSRVRGRADPKDVIRLIKRIKP